MTRLPLLSVFVLCLFALPAAHAALPRGAKAPDFTARASLDGQTMRFSMADALENGPVVLYFFPAAFTRGCDLEAHTFATHKAQFSAMNTTIIGLSADSIDRLNDFSSDPDFCAGEFPVASDPQGKIAARYGLEMQAPKKNVHGVRGGPITHGFLPRTTFVIDGDGQVAAVFSSQTDGISPAEHVTRALKIVKRLQAE